MTERERWIVYPLLFLALGAALRDKLFDVTSSKRIVCEQMIVVGNDPVSRAPTELVVVGEVQGSTRNGRPFGAVEVDGIVRSRAVETDGVIRARTVEADNFVFRGIPFGPGLLSPADWLRALQQAAKARQESDESGGLPPGRIVPLSPQTPPRPENAAPNANEPTAGGDAGTNDN